MESIEPFYIEYKNFEDIKEMENCEREILVVKIHQLMIEIQKVNFQKTQIQNLYQTYTRNSITKCSSMLASLNIVDPGLIMLYNNPRFNEYIQGNYIELESMRMKYKPSISIQDILIWNPIKCLSKILFPYPSKNYIEDFGRACVLMVISGFIVFVLLVVILMILKLFGF